MGTPKELKLEDTLQLNVGSVLNILDGVVGYQVTAIDQSPQGAPRITLERTPFNETAFNLLIKERYGNNDVPAQILCPPTITKEFTEKDKILTIGREFNAETDIVVPKNTISRAHGFIQYSRSGHCFHYYHNGRNTIKVVDVPPPAPARYSDPSSINTIIDRVGKDKRDEKGLIIPLEKGTRIAFHRNTHTYKVVMEDRKNHHIILEDEHNSDDDNRYPFIIDARDKMITIGSAPENHVRFKNAVISKRQGMIGWSEEHQGFIYHYKGESVPIVQASEALVAEQKRVCGELSPVPAMATLQLEKINELLRRIDIYQTQLNNVQDLEASIIGAYGRIHGSKTEDSQIGYALWLDCLAELFSERLSSEDKENIARMTKMLNQMAADRTQLRDIEEKCAFPLAGEFKERMDRYVDKKMAELENDNEVYVVTGFRGHHTISRIRREESGHYKLTIYNAGAEAIPVKHTQVLLADNKVMGMYEKNVKPGTDIKNLIRLLSEKKIRKAYAGDYEKIFDQINDCLEPGMVRHKEVPAQTRGNCTTRSTRHALEDALGDKVMGLFGRYVANPEVSAADDLKEALNIRKKKLQSICGIDSKAGDRIGRTDPPRKGGWRGIFGG